MLHQVVHTNGITDSWAQDPNKMQRPASIAALKAGSPLFATGAYSYDGAGNVEKIGNSYFVYDKVSRLVEGQICTGPGGGGTQVYQTYAFDPYTATSPRSKPTASPATRRRPRAPTA